ncbi:PQQ-binding-like beta-propeller repeat protein [Marivirga sp. S37H4]|uniref:PQQ-binding-like beta-propeller repeat protein n=1 Tax=Marivirga aurantiaca TaxID=2802615 RepID=A0A934X073_9BACT|nr:PQQ-binding-like beta-propeller repeat protein [Marivirga aurantiaca]MBK6266102.1 PQQ-binding-like beta-propeller repeat protein [Marivirga aurantiaca]
MSLLSSCNLFENKDSDKDSYQPLWEYNFDIGYFSSIDPVLYNDKVIFSALEEKKNDFSANSTLEAFDKSNGQLVWKWDETVKDSYDQFNNLRDSYLNGHILYISTGIDYAIDLNGGQTVHHIEEPKLNGQSFSGRDNYIFSSFLSYDEKKEIMKYTSLESFSWETLFEFENNDSSMYYVRHALFDNSFPGKVYFPYSRWSGGESRPHLLIYNFTEKSELLNVAISIQSGSHSIDYSPVLYGDRIFLSLSGLVACINKNSGELIWQKELNGNSSRSGILYTEDDGFYVNTEFYLYSIDPENGNILWQKESRAASRLQYHKGVIYYTGGTSLRAVDAITGESLMAIEAPSRAEDDGAFFQSVITIDHENDRIYTASYTHAYCYPTLR